MVKQYQRSLPELLDAYRDYLYANVSKVRILGEADERELKDVFVELSIVDQRAPQQHAEFLGLMDSAVRRRFNPVADVDRDDAALEMPGTREKSKRHMRPAELLRRRTKAIISGAPGCGKSTLLKYLALQAREQGNLAVWLELKAIDRHLFSQAESAAARSGHLILQEIWLRHLQAQLSLSAADINLLRAHWQEKFQLHEITVLLDGFDELQDEASERSLNNCVGQFASALYDNALLISTRPYAQARLGHERLQEVEIEPLNQRQIKAFLNCYYPNDAAIKSLLKTLRERASLRELMRVPLLLGVVLRLHRQNSFTDERLKLYESIIADLLHKLDLSKSVSRRFKINDEVLRLDFLKFLAFERLLRDLLDREEQEANRIVFSYDLLKEKARTFLAQEYPSHNPRDLANDALATPLLREVGVDTYAFTHLNLQEYLAARGFAAFYQRKGNEIEGLKIFCRAYHNPMIVEMEVLPMILGATTDADTLYAEIERWPESLNFANLRLRARGLAYAAKIKPAQLSKLTYRLCEFISEDFLDETPYREAVVSSFVGADRKTISAIENQAVRMFEMDPPYVIRTARILGQIGSDHAIDVLISALNGSSRLYDWGAATALGEIGSEKAVDALISAMTNKFRRGPAAEALGLIGSEKAVDALVSVMNDEDNFWEPEEAAEALGLIGSEKAVDPLISVLNDKSSKLREIAAKALARIGSEKAVDALISVLPSIDIEDELRAMVAEAFVIIGSDRAIDVLISLLNDDDRVVRARAAEGLGRIGSEKAVDALMTMLNDSDSKVCGSVASSLGEIGSERAVGALISAVSNEECSASKQALAALGKIGSERAVDGLVSALNSHDSLVRGQASAALGWARSKRAIGDLISALNDEEGYVRWQAANALGLIGSTKAVDALVSSLNDDDDGIVRATAAEALGRIGSEKAVTGLISALNNEASYYCAAEALGMIGSDKAVDALNLFMNNSGIRARMSARALRRTGPWRYFDSRHDFKEIDYNHWRVVDSLILAFKKSDDNHRLGTYASALGRIGLEKGVVAFMSVLNDQDLGRRSISAKALAQMDAKALTLGLERTLKQTDTGARRKAATVIGYYSNEKSTLSHLERLAQTDKSKEVRDAAKEASEKFARKLELLGQVISASSAQPLSDNATKEGVLVHEVGLIVSAAGHFFREVLKYDEGVDGEIEFRDVNGRGSGQRVYLQLKSGDSHLAQQKSGKEIFKIKKPRHARYWLAQAYPVLLVIRNGDGRIRWMNVTEYLQHHGANIRQIEFQGERFTAASVKQMCTRFAR